MIVLIVLFDQVTKYFARLYLYGKPAVNFIKGVAEFTPKICTNFRKRNGPETFLASQNHSHNS